MQPTVRNYEEISAQLIRALRGKRSQQALSRRLGSKSNVVYTWESRRRWPTAAKFLWVSSRCGVDVKRAVSEFYRSEPEWLRDANLFEASGVAALLTDLKAHSTVAHLAELTGYSRFAIARWLKGQAEPKLPEFLRLIDALSLRLLDWVSAFINPELVPCLAEGWRELQAARKAAYDLPWSHAVLRLLETREYQQLKRHQPGFIAGRLGLTMAEEEQCLEALRVSGQVSPGPLYRVRETQAVDTRQDPAAGQNLKVWWSEVALRQLKAEGAGRFSYNLFTVSRKDYRRLEELHLAYFRELRAIVAESAPAERVALVNMQLLPLEGLAPRSPRKSSD